MITNRRSSKVFCVFSFFLFDFFLSSVFRSRSPAAEMNDQDRRKQIVVGHHQSYAGQDQESTVCSREVAAVRTGVNLSLPCFPYASGDRAAQEMNSVCELMLLIRKDEAVPSL